MQRLACAQHGPIGAAERRGARRDRRDRADGGQTHRSLAETMTRESLDDFFTHYADAFSRRDVEEIGRLWKLPALITSREAFRRNT